MSKYYKYIGKDAKPDSWFIIEVESKHTKSADRKSLAPGTVIHNHNCDLHDLGAYSPEWVMGAFEEYPNPFTSSPSCWDEAEKEIREMEDQIGRKFTANDVIHHLRYFYRLIKKDK